MIIHRRTRQQKSRFCRNAAVGGCLLFRPLSGNEQTSGERAKMTASDPQQTFRSHLLGSGKILGGADLFLCTVGVLSAFIPLCPSLILKCPKIPLRCDPDAAMFREWTSAMGRIKSDARCQRVSRSNQPIIVDASTRASVFPCSIRPTLSIVRPCFWPKRIPSLLRQRSENPTALHRATFGEKGAAK
jgi:hypothetical protein